MIQVIGQALGESVLHVRHAYETADSIVPQMLMGACRDASHDKTGRYCIQTRHVSVYPVTIR